MSQILALLLLINLFLLKRTSNASGRTRALVTDKSDATGNTYLAASIGGGIWRGVYNPSTLEMAWSNLTPDIENLDFVSIAQSESNPDVIYAGTGEKSLSEMITVVEYINQMTVVQHGLTYLLKYLERLIQLLLMFTELLLIHLITIH